MRSMNYQIKSCADALADFSKAISLAPETPLYYHWRSQTYAALKDKRRAEADMTKARALGYKDI